MADTITVKFKVMEDGSLKAIGQDAEKAAKSTKKASDAAAQHNKQQKGVAGATANSTKGFSKMTTGMQGGLVPAYAEVAARVFALTAAFGVLSRNDAIAKLQEGIEFTGRAAGRNLTFVADKLQEITDNAISAEQAMRATAVGVSAGFSEDQMSGLAEVAKGASLALGRDMADAMDRLIRGAAKLEPEILDELGIMVRLDEASETYARTLNKTVGELTQFEKRMAFTNAIIEQGRQKFDGISEAIEASAFSKLSASLQDVAKGFIGILNKVLGPMANFLAENTAALGALVALYAGSVAGTILGGITSMAAASAKGAERTTAQSKAALKGIKPVKGLGNAFNVLAHKTDRSAKSLTGMNKSLTTTINHHNSSAKTVRLATKLRNQLTTEIHRADLAQAKHNFTNALGVLQEVGIAAGVRVHIQALRDLATATGAAMAQQTAFYAVLTFGRGIMLAVSATLKFLGASFLVVMPYIGIFLAAVAILGPMLTSLFGMEDTRLEKAIKKNAERTEEFKKVLEQYNKTIGKAKGATQLWANTLKPLSGLLSETSAAVSSTIAAARTQQILAEVAATTKLTNAIKAKKAQELDAAKNKGSSNSNTAGLAEYGAVKAAEAELKNAQSMSEGVKELVKNDILNSMAEFQATTEGMAIRLGQLAAEGEPVQDALNAVAAGQAGVQKIMAEFDADLISSEEASRQLIALDTSTQAVVQSFESFTDIINKAKDLTGDVTSTWGTYGKEIDNVAQGLINVNKILKDGKGIIAANEKATDLLKAYGIDPTDNPVEKLAQFEAGLRLINGAYKELELKEANSALTNTSAIASGITLLQNLEARLSLTQQELVTKELIGSNTAAEHTLLLQKLDIQKQITDELDKQAQKVADRATRLGGEVFGQSFAAAEGYADYNAENPDAKQSEKMAKLNELAQPQLQALSGLSPEGALMSSAIEGALVLQEAFSMAFEDIGAGGDKMQIGLEVAAAGLNVISGMMAASSKAQVASIDKQIEAEKKRDGKSVASIAKIKAMEKKKEAIKRKAFETDKKLKMATVMISTASAVMKAVEESPTTGGMPFSGFAIAMGAAQLAAIASTSYQGGGTSAGAPSAPTAIAVGSRNASVDLAKGQNAGGELAYARGAQGIGTGMTDFKPTSAFAGYKHRAGGGYVVGEQGPELFMPETPGQIIPSGQGTGGQTNVNFSINAVDSAGVEDLLMNQRGNIIGMIREAANEHGEFFLESVQDKSY